MKILLALLLTMTTSLAMETNKAAVALPGTCWEVSSYAEQTPLADHPITFEFDAQGNISGDGSCNRFGGTCAIAANTIKVGPLRSTRRACEPEIMQQEHKFLALLGSVASWTIDPEGILVLVGEDGEIRAKKRTDSPGN